MTYSVEGEGPPNCIWMLKIIAHIPSGLSTGVLFSNPPESVAPGTSDWTSTSYSHSSWGWDAEAFKLGPMNPNIVNAASSLIPGSKHLSCHPRKHRPRRFRFGLLRPLFCGPEFPAIKDSKRKDAVRSLAARLPHPSNQTSNHRPNGPLCTMASGLSTTLGLKTYREQDSNLHVLGTPDPKSGASTNSAIPALAGRLGGSGEITRGHWRRVFLGSEELSFVPERSDQN